MVGSSGQWSERLYAAAGTVGFGALLLGARLAGVPAAALRQRRGLMPACAPPCLWLHGASAGEMAAASNLVAVLRAGGARFAAAYTTTNDAGLRLIGRRLAGGDVAALAPWDAPRWTARACDAWRPAALVLIETELWPGLIGAAAARGIPVVCASARIYPRDLARYRLVRRWLRPMFGRLAAVLAQSDLERERFVALGVSPARCVAAGNLKHVRVVRGDAAAFRRAVGAADGEPLCVFGSLHADEVAFVAAAVERAGARVVLAPRHPGAGAAIVRLAARRGWRLARRSQPGQTSWRVLLLDSMGELAAAYAAAAVAVVGGSFAAHGGHDLIEPLRAGAAVLFGPHTGHVAEAAALAALEPTVQVATPDALAHRVAGLVADPAGRRVLHERQRAALPDADAIATRYRRALMPMLSTGATEHPAVRRAPLCSALMT